jgi:16S rRNA (guanine527-N7)-methyltransferase
MDDAHSDALLATLTSGLDALGIDRAHAPALLGYLALLARWNRTYNLTAIRDVREMVPRHLLDSLAMHAHLDGVENLADLGTGPGLPGIPLAIARPALRVALVESNGKKARFLREAARRLALPNVEVVESRIEHVDAPGAFDAITARALATLPEILALGGHLIAPHGRLLAMKGALPREEIDALPPGWRMQVVHPLCVPGLEAERHLVVVERGPRAEG